MKPEGWREVSSIGFISDLAISSNLVDAPAADRGVLLLGSDANNELRAYHPTTGVFLDWSLHLPDSSGRGQVSGGREDRETVNEGRTPI